MRQFREMLDGRRVAGMIRHRGEETMRADVFKDEQGEWRFRVVAGNNEPVAQSEGYKNQGDAKAIAADLVGEENVRVVEEDR